MKDTSEEKRTRGRRERPKEEEVPVETAPAPAEGKTRRNRNVDGDKKAEDSAGGWMSANFEKRGAAAVEEDDTNEDAALNTANKDKHFQDDKEGGDILDIPDLEEDGLEGDHRVAHAPRNILRKIPTLAELEADVKSSIPKDEGGLDLSILLGVLVPKSQLEEADTTWTFESLLTEVTDELTGTEKLVVNTILKEPKAAPASGTSGQASKSKITGEKTKREK